MKNLKILGLLIIALIGFNSCQTEDDVVFVANNSELSFTNSFSSEYILTPATAGNLGERFTWNTPDMGVPTNITYELQKSITGDFSDMEVVGSTTANEISITIGDMLGFAAQAGLDNDPNTENPDTGTVSFRLRSFAGTGGLEAFSSAQALTLVLPQNNSSEEAVCEFDQLWLVGAGVPDAGWGWATPVQLPCTGNGVYSGNVNLQNNGGADNNFRFFTEATNWGSGRNYPYYEDLGYTIDANFANAMDGDSNFAFVGTTGQFFLTVDTVNKTITLGEPQATGTCEFDQLWLVGAGVPDAGWGWATPVQLLCTGDGIYSGNVNFQNNGGADNNFRFFTEATNWDSGRNYPYYEDLGYTIDANFTNAMDGDSNFAFIGTTGTYLLTVNTVTKVITLE
ncbi:MAG: SusE domain-containing protein [Gelidibacter sp.]